MVNKWHKNIREILNKKGKLLGFNLNTQLNDVFGGFRVYPDVVWKKGQKINYIFEIETTKSKSLLGTYVQGFLISKNHKAPFIFIVKNKSIHNYIMDFNNNFEKILRRNKISYIPYILLIKEKTKVKMEKEIYKTMDKVMTSVRQTKAAKLAWKRHRGSWFKKRK